VGLEKYKVGVYERVQKSVPQVSLMITSFQVPKPNYSEILLYAQNNPTTFFLSIHHPTAQASFSANAYAWHCTCKVRKHFAISSESPSCFEYSMQSIEWTCPSTHSSSTQQVHP
jgi:hypothetical protein